MKNPVSDGIRQRVGELMKELGIKKTRLGEILGDEGRKDESNQQKYLRADRFLRSHSEVGADKLIKLSNFFSRPIDFFLQPVMELNSSDVHNVQGLPPINEIEKSLRRMGLDETYIKNEIEQLKAMELYKAMTK